MAPPRKPRASQPKSEVAAEARTRAEIPLMSAGPAGGAIGSGIGRIGELTINRQRIPSTIDPLGQESAALGTGFQALRADATQRMYLGLQQVQDTLGLLHQAISQPTIPAQLLGTLQQPDGAAANLVQVEFDPSDYGTSGQPVVRHTDDSGFFQLPIPNGITLPEAGISLTVHGSTATVTVTVAKARIASNGMIGTVVLPETIAPLQLSVLAALEALVPPATSPDAPPVLQSPPALPTVKLGDDDDCLISYGSNNAIDTFPYGVFFRLIEPRMSIVNQVERVPLKHGGHGYLPRYQTSYESDPADGTVSEDGTTTYLDRIPIEQPLSVDGFRDEIMGLTPEGFYAADETVAMAGTLGLGYVLWMSQQWTFQGLGLGDLVYSLPLAPGEQQQVAVFERTDTASVTESEFFSQEEAQAQSALADTSTTATFNSAFNEVVNGGSTFHADTTSEAASGSILIASGAASHSSSNGGSTEWLNGQRDAAQNAAQTTHSAASNQASARRTASRTGMRMATASESESVTTKVIANHNHTHALTMQYWEVQRLYDVSTGIDGLSLACLIPMQVVRFMPPGQPFTLDDTTLVSTRQDVLGRYQNILKHADVLAASLPRPFQYGLNLLRQFASDPTADVETAGGVAEDVIDFELGGTFLNCEDVSISVVTNRNTRVGPVRLTNTATTPAADTFATRDELVAWLISQRQGSPTTFSGHLALPPSMNRSDVIGFEITRSFRPLAYTLVNPQVAAVNELNKLFGSASWLGQVLGSSVAQEAGSAARTTVNLSPSDLESALGGPLLTKFSASIVEYDASGGALPSAPTETYANESLAGVELPPQVYPVPAMQIGPVLRFNQILEIERMASHVARNSVRYSEALWRSLSAEERAILLDGYTIGVPSGGVSDESQMVPLLNCVENRVVGFFGNSMIMPFIIPQAVAETMKIDPVQIQSSLLTYQQATFKPPRSVLALPTRGVLGEAVLGHCSSAELIDLTRFWNWQDSPGDTAPTISPVTLPTTTPSIATGETAPNSLTTLQPLINNILAAPTPNTALLQALGQAAAAMPDFNPALTGAQQLQTIVTGSQQAATDSMKQVNDLQAQVLATIGNLIGGAYAGNSTAGSSAASSVRGTPQPNAPSGTGKTGATGTGKSGPSGPSAPSGPSGPSAPSGPSGPTGPSGGTPSGPTGPSTPGTGTTPGGDTPAGGDLASGDLSGGAPALGDFGGVTDLAGAGGAVGDIGAAGDLGALGEVGGDAGLLGAAGDAGDLALIGGAVLA